MIDKCPHGYFTHSSSNRCPWCYGFDDANRDVIPVVGHGNGWLLRSGAAICTSCGGPSEAGWGMITSDWSPDRPPPSMCYSCRCGENTKETLERRAVHEAARGKKKPRAGKSAP